MVLKPIDPIMGLASPPQKTIRSHQQNQERAFIAASRRGDRGIEARLQSARRASEVHKLRTGKGLWVTRDIVLKEEMYEEVDDMFPRSYQLRGPRRPSLSVEEGSPKSPATTAELASGQDQQLHENEVNREFAQYFPEVDQILSQPWSTQSILMASPTQRNRFQELTRKGFESSAQDIDYTQGAVLDARSRSLPESSPPELRMDVDLTPPSLATESGSYPATPRSQAASVFKQTTPIDLCLDCNCNYGEPAFVCNLPPEANVLLADSDVVDPALYDQQWLYGTLPSDPYGVSELLDIDVEDDVFNEIHDDSLNRMSWDQPSQPKTSTLCTSQ
ncbi:hypothetical protein AUP68_07496 [Ilyonectria robusta]